MPDIPTTVDEREPASVPRVCVAVVVEYDGGRVLLLRRSESSTFPRTWCLPGGRLEAGETLEQCCRRELLEETGLSAERFTFECVTEVAGPPHLVGLVYKAHRATGMATNAEPDKHDEIGLFRPDQFPSLLMPGVVWWLEDQECPAAELARLTRERDQAIRRQLHAGSDGDRWYVADGVRVEDRERLGPFRGEAEAFASVLAWIEWALDPEGVPMPEYRTADEEENP